MTPVLEDFTGQWQLSRAITEASGSKASFSGQAWFTPEGAGLGYREEGVLQLPGQTPIRAERRYLWQAAPEGGIAVLFSDGRPFHRFDPGQARPEDRHYCDPDIYDVVYDFDRWPEWRSRWRVTGPRKDYEMTTQYWRG